MTTNSSILTPDETHYQEREKEHQDQQKWYSEHVTTFENLWTSWPYVAGTIASFPRLSMVAEHQTDNPRYYSSGRLRRDENHCVFIYTLEGNGYFRDGDGEYRVGVGEGFLCAIDDLETSYYYGDQNQGVWHFLSVCVEGEAAQVMVHDLVKSRGPIFKVALNAPLWRQLQSLKAGDYSWPHMSMVTSVELASMLMLVLWQGSDRVPEESADILIKKAMHRLSLPSPLPEIGELADSLHVSREHFSRVFRRHVGVSPQSWINQERISRACRLLCTTEMSNKQLAHQLGYEQPSSFLRAFRRATQMTPQQFRHNAQQTPAEPQS